MSRTIVLLVVGLGLLLPPPSDAAPSSSFNLFVRETGVYRLTYEDLVEQGWRGGAVRSARLGLVHRGQPVPIFVEDHGDGRFGPGDWIELVGHRLPGEASYYDEIAPLNAYRLDLRAQAAHRSRMRTLPPPSAPAATAVAPFLTQRHYEENRLLLRFRPDRGAEGGEELWYWAKLSHLDAEPFRLILSFEDRRAAEPLRLRAHFRGWSTPRRGAGKDLADHRIVLAVNGAAVASSEWNGQEASLLETDVPADLLLSGENTIAFEVPRRQIPDSEEPLIDVLLLNWVEVEYRRGGAVDSDEQLALTVATSDPSAPLALSTRGGCNLTLFGTDGSRIDSGALVESGAGERSRCLFEPSPRVAAGDARLLVVPEGGFALPVGIELDRPSRLLRRGGGADYLIIAHPSLMRAVEPLAEHHRRRGLEVLVTDVRDVYDELNHGIPHPRALRDLVRHAYHSWSPRPRFVLLVGDASWDPHNREVTDDNYTDWTYRPGETRRFVKNGSTPYAERANLNRRNLVPTWNYASYEGHAASDNWFVSVDGDDFFPDLAIGRLPVVEPVEVERIVAKTIRYATAGVGPWRRRLLWLTNEQRHYQRWSDELAAAVAERGFGSSRVYPQPEESGNELHQTRLRSEFDEGNLLVHFVGHGGRYIWRTGPPDYEKNHDLFTLDDLDRLEPGSPLSVVLAMTCYSAPFDHPTADSIGEKFLRLADAGAVAVVAASWRNSPTRQFSQALVDELLAGGPIGEAVRRAKLELRNRNLVETYNLLGDPAVPIALPELELELAATDELAVLVEVADEGFRGEAIVEWLGADGDVLWREAVEVDSSTFHVPFAGRDRIDARPTAISAYVWNDRRQIDGMGHVGLDAEPAVESAGARAGGSR
jgi:hypothetical protein